MTGSTDCWRSANSSLALNNIAIVGLHMIADTWTGVGADAPVGVYMLRNGENLLVEDCLIEKYANNIVVQGYPTTFTNAQVRRCVLSDPFRTDTGDTNIYVENVDGVLLEENVISNLLANDARGNQISHNIYIQETCARNSAIVRGNIVYNGRTNLTVRCGGRVENNLAIRGGQGIAIGYNVGTPNYVPAVVRGNVITESRNHWNGQLLGLGICFDNVDGVDCSNNVIYHGTDGGYHIGIMVNGNNRAIDVANNVVYDWQQSGGSPCAFQVVTTSLAGPITVHDNQFQQPTWGQLVWNEGGASSVVAYSNNKEHAAIARPFYDSSYLSFSEWQAAHEATANSNVPAYFDVSRNPGAYNAVLGGEASTEGFISVARHQSHAAWRTEYTAQAFNDYVRGGFNMVMGTP